MASILKVDTITGVTTAGSIAVTGEGNSTTTNLQQGLAKSWLNYDQKDTITIRDSFNVASVADDGSGAFTPAYTSNMANGNYAPHMCSIATTSNLGFNRLGSVANTQTGSCQYVHYENSNGTDTDLLAISVDGDLA